MQIVNSIRRLYWKLRGKVEVPEPESVLTDNSVKSGGLAGWEVQDATKLFENIPINSAGDTSKWDFSGMKGCSCSLNGPSPCKRCRPGLISLRDAHLRRKPAFKRIVSTRKW